MLYITCHASYTRCAACYMHVLCAPNIACCVFCTVCSILYVFHSIHVIYHVCYLQLLTDTGQLSLPGGGDFSSSRCPLLPAIVAAKEPRPGSEPFRREDCATSWPWRAHGLQWGTLVLFYICVILMYHHFFIHSPTVGHWVASNF